MLSSSRRRRHACSLYKINLTNCKLPLENLQQNGNELNYTFTKSQTNMLLIKFGFTFKAERSYDDDNDSFDYSPNNDNSSQPSRGKSNELKRNPQPKVGY